MPNRRKTKYVAKELSASEIRRIKREIDNYKRTLTNKVYKFCDRLAGEGIRVARANISLAEESSEPGLSTTTLSFDIIQNGVNCTMNVHMEGDDVAFIEFGAGRNDRVGNARKNISASQNGMGPGTYNPESDNWNDPNGWWYTGSDGKPQHSYGVTGTAPMYYLSLEFKKKAKSIAKEVFQP